MKKNLQLEWAEYCKSWKTSDGRVRPSWEKKGGRTTGYHLPTTPVFSLSLAFFGNCILPFCSHNTPPLPSTLLPKKEDAYASRIAWLGKDEGEGLYKATLIRQKRVRSRLPSMLRSQERRRKLGKYSIINSVKFCMPFVSHLLCK